MCSKPIIRISNLVNPFKSSSGNALTEDVDASDLFLHLLGVELAHVAAAVALLHLPDLQLPDAVLLVVHVDARVVRDHALVQRQDRLVLRLQPTNLQ